MRRQLRRHAAEHLAVGLVMAYTLASMLLGAATGTLGVVVVTLLAIAVALVLRGLAGMALLQLGDNDAS